MKLKSRIYFNNDDVLTMCYNLEYEAAKVNPDLIVGIKRGGLVPAVHLSHALARLFIHHVRQTIHPHLERQLSLLTERFLHLLQRVLLSVGV